MVFTYLLDEGYKQFSAYNEELPSKGNDMGLFHFLSAGSHVIDYAPGMLRKYLKDKDLILNKRFTPFPLRSKTDINSDPLIPSISEDYPSKIGYKNNVPGMLMRPKAFQLDINSDPHIHQPSIPDEYFLKDGFENNVPGMLMKPKVTIILDLNRDHRDPYIYQPSIPEEHLLVSCKNDSKGMSRKDYRDIEDLILNNKRSAPFSPRLEASQLDPNNDSHIHHSPTTVSQGISI